jgi:hypothetical protein
VERLEVEDDGDDDCRHDVCAGDEEGKWRVDFGRGW